MKIKTLRSIHLYMGCFFTPLLLFFIVSGCLQTYHLHQSKKDGSYKAPAVVRSLSAVHMHQRNATQNSRPSSSNGFRWLVLLMSVGLTLSVIIGVVLAFKYTRAWIVWMNLLGGILVPVLLLFFV